MSWRTLTRYVLLNDVVNPLFRTTSGYLLVASLILATIAMLAGGFSHEPLTPLHRLFDPWLLASAMTAIGGLVVMLIPPYSARPATYEVIFHHPVTVRSYAASLITSNVAVLTLFNIPAAVLISMLALGSPPAALGIINAIVALIVFTLLAAFLKRAAGASADTLLRTIGGVVAAYTAASIVLGAPNPAAWPLLPYAYSITAAPGPWLLVGAAETCGMIALILLVSGRLSPYDIAPMASPAPARAGGGSRLSFRSPRLVLYSFFTYSLVGPRVVALVAASCVAAYAAAHYLLVSSSGGWLLAVSIAGALLYYVLMIFVSSDVASAAGSIWFFRVYLAGRLTPLVDALASRYALAVFYCCLVNLCLLLGGVPAGALLLYMFCSAVYSLLAGYIIVVAACHIASKEGDVGVRGGAGMEGAPYIRFWLDGLVVAAALGMGLGVPFLASALANPLWLGGVAALPVARWLAEKVSSSFDVLV